MLKRSLQFLKRTLTRPEGLTLESIGPVSRYFGEDRGTPIDRYYIEQFLNANKQYIKGDVLEVAEDKYIRRFGSDVTSYNVLHPVIGTPGATIIGDLTDIASLPANRFDCFVCTQTFNFIYDFKTAIKGAHYLLKPGGSLIATVAGISQISTFDANRWGDYWRFTSQSVRKSFDEVFSSANANIETYGNCYAAVSFIRGLATEELNPKHLNTKDDVYPIIIGITIKK